MKKIRIAVVIPTHSNLRSSLHALFGVYSYLVKNRNVEVTIFTDVSNKESYADFEVVKITSPDRGTIFSKALLFFGLPRHYYSGLPEKLKGYDVIESSNPEFYIFAYQSYIAAKKYNSRLVLRTSQTVDGFYLFRISKYLIMPFARKAYHHAKYLLFTNPEALARAERLGLVERDSGKCIITGHATDTSTFRPIKVKMPEIPVILSVGGLYRIKGHQIIIRALEKIRKKIDAELWIVGDGYYKDSLLKCVQSTGVQNYVKFLGSKSKEELAQIYNMASVFALANHQEITPAVNEALACGTPVVVMECGGRKFVLPDGGCGLVSKKFDVDDMAEKIAQVLSNRKLAGSIAEKGRQRILENFSTEKVAQKFYRSFTK